MKCAMSRLLQLFGLVLASACISLSTSRAARHSADVDHQGHEDERAAISSGAAAIDPAGAANRPPGTSPASARLRYAVAGRNTDRTNIHGRRIITISPFREIQLVQKRVLPAPRERSATPRTPA